MLIYGLVVELPLPEPVPVPLPLPVPVEDPLPEVESLEPLVLPLPLVLLVERRCLRALRCLRLVVPPIDESLPPLPLVLPDWLPPDWLPEEVPVWLPEFDEPLVFCAKATLPMPNAQTSAVVIESFFMIFPLEMLVTS